MVLVFTHEGKDYWYGMQHAFEEELPSILGCAAFDLPIDDPVGELLAGRIEAEVNGIQFRFSTSHHVFTSRPKRLVENKEEEADA